MVNLLPVVVYVNVKPEDAVPDNEKAAVPRVWSPTASKVICWGALETKRVLSAEAAPTEIVPACVAVITAVPAPTIVIVLPLTVATDVLPLEKVTGRDRSDVAVTVKGASPNCFGGISANVIV